MNERMIVPKKTIVTLSIFYWMPDYNRILQEFYWQTDDVRPEYPRVHRFLNYWHNNIEAVIEEINITDSYKTSYK
jgi:uncharacterized protein Usg